MTPAPWVGPGSSLPPQGYDPSNQWTPSSPMPAQPGFIPPELRNHVPPGGGGTPLPSNVNVEFMGGYPNVAPTSFAGSDSLPAGGDGGMSGGMSGRYPGMTPFEAPMSSPWSTPRMGMGGMGMGTPYMGAGMGMGGLAGSVGGGMPGMGGAMGGMGGMGGIPGGMGGMGMGGMPGGMGMGMGGGMPGMGGGMPGGMPGMGGGMGGMGGGMGGMGGMGSGMDGMGGGIPGGMAPSAPAHDPFSFGQMAETLDYLYPSSHLTGSTGDHLPPFTAGPGYGPVLTPLQLSILGVLPILNPLLAPLPNSKLTKPTHTLNGIYSSQVQRVNALMTHLMFLGRKVEQIQLHFLE
ncbi:hypothetical protein D9758_017568 [Tetrapyrgos nigripes]|uniref:Uncharacterized protein n=1 Tax=Tetrapyrgos nigripes TaxID=182062 RepID=A0A8H5C3U2_9AGAR|nr:hypothetical protein D9758_017568 [Tetrapyrgos nigripes]